MKGFHFFIIAGIVVTIVAIVIIKFPIHYEPTVIIPKKLSEIVVQLSNSTSDGEKARMLAESSPKVKSILDKGNFHYDGVFYSGNQNKTFVNVVYQSNTTGPLVITEDRQITKILNVTIQEDVHYAGIGK